MAAYPSVGFKYYAGTAISTTPTNANYASIVQEHAERRASST